MQQVKLKPIEFTTIAILPIGKNQFSNNEKGSIFEPFFILYKFGIRMEPLHAPKGQTQPL